MLGAGGLYTGHDVTRNPLCQFSVLLLAFCAALPARAYHPLLTEDTETQGKGKHQIEMTLDVTRDRNGAATQRSRQASLVYAYGLTKTLDVEVGLPHLQLRADDGAGAATRASGVGDGSVEFKWQFYEKDGFTLGVKPGLTLSSGDASRRLGQGRANAGAVMMAGYEKGSWEFYGHFGLRTNRNTLGERRSLYQASVLTIWEAVERLWLTAETGVLRQPDPAISSNPRFLGVAVIWGPTKDVDLDVGVRRGLNAAAPDRVVSAGVTVRW
jgi:hypothetical protein